MAFAATLPARETIYMALHTPFLSLKPSRRRSKEVRLLLEAFVVSMKLGRYSLVEAPFQLSIFIQPQDPSSLWN